MKRHSLWFLISAILILTSLACSFGVPAASRNFPTTNAPVIVVTPPSAVALPQQNPDLEYQDTLLTTLYEHVSPGIVSIQVLSEAGDSLGSGFVFDKQGNVVTNYHVVEGAQDLEVDFPSGLKVRGKVVGQDLDSDIAVINVKAPAEALFPLEMGDSGQLKVGQTVVAIGNPFGLTGTMTTGIVSARGRTLDSIRQTSSGTPFSAGGLIQTDAAINPGNSGGPLLDLKGRVIGINRAIRTTSTNQTGDPTSSGVGFAVPVNIVKRVVPILIQKGSYDYPYLGISTREELSLLDQEALGLSQSAGAYIVDIVPGGPADKAGLKGASSQNSASALPTGGDLIIAIDDQPVHVFGDMLTYLMENKSPGDTVKLTILRDNQKKEVNLTLEKRP
jgi:S1-C subfamily serine protease